MRCAGANLGCATAGAHGRTPTRQPSPRGASAHKVEHERVDGAGRLVMRTMADAGQRHDALHGGEPLERAHASGRRPRVLLACEGRVSDASRKCFGRVSDASRTRVGRVSDVCRRCLGRVSEESGWGGSGACLGSVSEESGWGVSGACLGSVRRGPVLAVQHEHGRLESRVGQLLLGERAGLLMN